ncbi:MAG: RDD family protein [Clostridiales bacterium]|nr:RDD family protein [Clostridiales bacterium]
MSEDINVSVSKEEKVEEAKLVAVKPARRFAARVLDIAFITSLLFPVVYFLGFTEITVRNYIIVQAMLAALFLIYDWLMTAVLGATVGKLLLGLGVTKDTTEKITFAGALKRSVLLLAAGLGLLIPPVTLVTVIVAFVMGRQKKKLIWEKGNKTYAHHLTGLRCAWSVFLIVALAMIFASPVVADQLKLVPYTGFIDQPKYEADYDAIEKKYLKSLKNSGREYDPDYYSSHKLYDAEGFNYTIDDAGFVRGFTYSSVALYNDSYSSEERDLVIIGITTLVTSVENNRATYNFSLDAFTKIFEKPFEDHDVTSGGVRVIHHAIPQSDGYLVTYSVCFTDYLEEITTDESV